MSYSHLFILLIKYILPFASTYLIDIIYVKRLFRFIKYEKKTKINKLEVEPDLRCTLSETQYIDINNVNIQYLKIIYYIFYIFLIHLF